MSRIISRKEAKARGLKRYFTGEPCKKGHTCERYVGTGHCAECELTRGKSDSHRKAVKRWYTANAERKKEVGRRRYKASAERVNERCRRWQKANPDKFNAIRAKRRSAKIRRTPPWADLKQIEKFYRDARIMAGITGESWHVDHVIPLQGKTVSGLHVHTNLQILPGKENNSKSNKFDPQEAAQFT